MIRGKRLCSHKFYGGEGHVNDDECLTHKRQFNEDEFYSLPFK
jgi:hypothetical protein